MTPVELPAEAFGRPLAWERAEADGSGMPTHWRGAYRSELLSIDVIEYPAAPLARRWIASVSAERGVEGGSNYSCGADADLAIGSLRRRLARGVYLAEILGVVPAAEPVVRAALEAMNHPAAR